MQNINTRQFYISRTKEKSFNNLKIWYDGHILNFKYNIEHVIIDE